jgi:dolichol kinase
MRQGLRNFDLSVWWYRDLADAISVIIASFAWVKIWGVAHSHGVPHSVSRKVVHATCGPLFVLFWPLFSPAPGARFFAALVPLMSLVRILLAASVSDGDLINSVSRTGRAEEVLGGPLYYSVVLLFATLFAWCSNVGVVAIAQMALGDGFADLVGRNFGRTRWSFHQDKTVEGTLAFVFFAYTGSSVLLKVVSDRTTESISDCRLLFISILCAASELLVGSTLCDRLDAQVHGEICSRFDDNLAVPALAAVLTFCLQATSAERLTRTLELSEHLSHGHDPERGGARTAG